MSSTPKRKPSKRTGSPGGGSQSSKKKKSATPSGVPDQDSQDIGNAAETVAMETEKIPVFKDAKFVHSTKGAAGNKKTRVWKNLKQIVAADRQLPWQPTDTLYGSIEAPPSFKPAKKYSDITGLPAKYTDPQTKLRYATPDEYTRIRMLPQDIVAGLLTLRKANAPVP
ncbi:INO80 complex subunit C-like [Lineus longissimus]|uniref:INO80 complex subunit C-like n=1 Tax=Lineus longissimus TaxID=88925 RepID=UPI002B4EF290